MFSVNGFDLDNPALGWVPTEGSSVVASTERDLLDLSAPGADGVTPIPGSTRPSLIVVSVETPRAYESDLRALFDADVLVLTEEGLDPGRV